MASSASRSKFRNTSQHATMQQPPPSLTSFPQPTQSLSNSFVDRFDNTTLQEPFSFSDAITEEDFPAQQQTPPPTHESSSRKKPQRPPIKFATPKTVGPRRKSAPGDEWLKRDNEKTPMRSPPESWTPFQFSPMDSAAFLNQGHGAMATAPANPSNVFWDPSFRDLDYSVPFLDDPFAPTTSASNLYTQSSPVQTTGRQAMPRSLFTHQQQSEVTGQAQNTTGSTNAARRPQVPPGHSSSSVDPSMLWSDSAVPQLKQQLIIGEPAKVPHPEKLIPYQTHFEERDREKAAKEDLRRKLAKYTRSFSHGDRELRRSATDNSARKNRSAIKSTRESFSSNTDRAMHSESPTKSLQQPGKDAYYFAVDKNGYAKLAHRKTSETNAELDLNRRSSRSSGVIDDTSSESSDRSQISSALDRLSSSRRPSPAFSDATEAIRQVRREAKKKRRQSERDHCKRCPHYHPYIPDFCKASYSKPSSSKNAAAVGGHHQTLMGNDQQGWANSNVSPTTISDPDLHAPAPAPADNGTVTNNFRGITRCICGYPKGGGLMIQCAHCKNWSHAETCLGLGNGKAPDPYICLFCEGVA